MPDGTQTTMLTKEELMEAHIEAAREEQKLRKKKSDYDGTMNNLIGIESKKQIAILEELDAVAAGRTEDLPFSGEDWSALVKSREPNV